jgi:V/A-type H+-transporting ATPase subunit D
MEMQRRIVFIERGTEFLKLKRDHLAKELSESIEVLRGRRRLLLESLGEAYKAVQAAYLSLGPTEVESQADSIRSTLDIDLLPKSIMGVQYPYIKILRRPKVEGELDITLSYASDKVFSILEEIIRLAEFESRVERIADELGRTNRKVNALENTVIPDMKAIIKFIQDKLDEEQMEDLVRIKLIGGALASEK